MSVLVSFNLASNRIDNLLALLENLEDTAADPTCLEVLVKIDDEDAHIAEALDDEIARRPFAIKYLSGPRGNGCFELWKSINQLHTLCDPEAYFVCNINDEIRFKTERWDENLANYKHLFADDIFRLRTSVSKYRNYSDFWECGYAPENYPFATKRWIDIQGDWNACHGPDAFQQYVAFYLSGVTWPAKEQFHRDIPITDIQISGEGIYKQMSEEQMWLRVQRGWKTWWRINSPKMQGEACRRATLLASHIWAEATSADTYSVSEDKLRSRVNIIRRETGIVEKRFSYRINKTRIRIKNLVRRPTKYRQCGGRPPPFRMWRSMIILRRWLNRRGRESHA